MRVAYGAAAMHARANGNYFARDEEFDALRSVIEDELGRQGLTSVDVAASPSADLDSARQCSSSGTQLRYAVNMFGDSISLAAATDERVFSYHYDPHEQATIAVAPAAACIPR